MISILIPTKCSTFKCRQDASHRCSECRKVYCSECSDNGHDCELTDNSPQGMGYADKISVITTSLTTRLKKSGYKENFGQDELRRFNKLLNNDDTLSYAERAMWSSRLSEVINNL